MTTKKESISVQDYILELIKEITGQKNILLIPRIFISITGSVNSALLLSQVLYWSDKSSITSLKRRLVFAKTKEEFGSEIGLGRRAFESAQQRLEDLELILTKTGGFAGKASTYWHPDIENIARAIQQVVQENNMRDSEVSSGYENFLEDFVPDETVGFLSEDGNSPSPKGPIVKALTAIEEPSKRTVANAQMGQMAMDKTCISNTETITDNSPETTTNHLPDTPLDCGRFLRWNKKEDSSQIVQEQALVDFVLFINPNLSIIEAKNLVGKLKAALVALPDVTMEQVQMMLTFSAVTGYSDYSQTDTKNGAKRTIVERWLMPALEWLQQKVTVDDIRKAVQGAIRDGFHKKLRCPASYSSRVFSMKEMQPTKTSHLDDEF